MRTGGKRCYFISLWQKREQTLTLARGSLEAPGLTLLRGCSGTCTAESPSWSRAAEQAGPVGSSSSCGQTFTPKGRGFQSSLVRLSGDPRLLHPLLCRRCRRSETKAGCWCRPELPQVLPEVEELSECFKSRGKHSGLLMLRFFSQLGCYQPQWVGSCQPSSSTPRSSRAVGCDGGTCRKESKIYLSKIYPVLGYLKLFELMDTNSSVKVTLEHVLCLLHQLGSTEQTQAGKQQEVGRACQ